jgi:hypothetical protein
MTEQSLFGPKDPKQRVLRLDHGGELARAASSAYLHASESARVLQLARDELARVRNMVNGSSSETTIVQAMTLLEASAIGIASARASVRALMPEESTDPGSTVPTTPKER